LLSCLKIRKYYYISYYTTQGMCINLLMYFNVKCFNEIALAYQIYSILSHIRHNFCFSLSLTLSHSVSIIFLYAAATAASALIRLILEFHLIYKTDMWRWWCAHWHHCYVLFTTKIILHQKKEFIIYVNFFRFYLILLG
jgi:hypothetical protein